jgi:rubrerythrin
MSKDAQLIRTIMARECDTVNAYEAMAEEAEDESIRNLILHIAEEELEHIAECARVLEKLDPRYARMVKHVATHLDDNLNPIKSPSSTLSEKAPSKIKQPEGFTVGSLIQPFKNNG